MKCTSPPGTRHLLPLTRHPPPATGGKVICSALCNVIAWWFKLERRRCRQKERHLKPFLHYSSLLIWLNCKIVFRDWKNCRVFTFHTQPHNGSLHVVHKTRTAAHKNENMPAQNEQKLQIFKIFKYANLWRSCHLCRILFPPGRSARTRKSPAKTGVLLCLFRFIFNLLASSCVPSLRIRELSNDDGNTKENVA